VNGQPRTVGRQCRTLAGNSLRKDTKLGAGANLPVQCFGVPCHSHGQNYSLMPSSPPVYEESLSFQSTTDPPCPRKVIDDMRESLTKRVCADNGKSWFDLGYVTQYSVWDRDRFIADVVVDKPACGY